MPLRLDPPALPEWEQPFATVQEQSRQLGLRAFVVGGYVRDRLLGGERGKTIREVDILVDGRGATQLATAVGSALKLRPPVIFERFGTAHLDLDHRALEFVSSRVESYAPSSRKPDVRPGTLEEDVMRRDFTINTLLMDWDGTVLDLTGRALQDLEARRIMTPLEPASTFDEDPLRKVQRGLELLDATRLLPKIVPQLEMGKGMQQGGWHSHDVFGHSLLTASLAPPELIARLAALLHDVGKPAVHELKDGKPTFIGHQEIGAGMAGAALRHLRYPGELTDAVVKLVRLHMRPIQYDPQGWEDKAVRRLVRDAGDQLERLLALARADMRASHYPDVKKIDDLEARIRRIDTQAIAAIRSPLTGEDLMARTGRPAGPWIKRVKTALEDAIIDGTLAPDAQAAWRYLEAHPELLQP
ncbi:MAG: HD domain-containing protein [Chloroflexi bacterium]|nr:MAG: HD domain-containing protein [Chloroflexota bacterium]